MTENKWQFETDSAQMANFWRFLCPVFPASRVQYISDLRAFYIRTKATPCVEVSYIQSATAEIRREKKKEER